MKAVCVRPSTIGLVVASFFDDQNMRGVSENDSMKTRIDHLVIGAGTLELGVTYAKECLGVDIPYGGVHLKMGTHNHLMQLGDSVFLEIIALHHEIDPPAAPRWYGLDDPFVRSTIEKEPAVLTWVVNTRDLNGLMAQANFCLGQLELICRGNLNWFFGLPEDGRLFAGGMLPYAIEWQTDIHPAARMADLGCRLQALELFHPHPGWLRASLDSIGAGNLVTIRGLPKKQSPYISAQISTPGGVKTLESVRLS